MRKHPDCQDHPKCALALGLLPKMRSKKPSKGKQAEPSVSLRALTTGNFSSRILHALLKDNLQQIARILSGLTNGLDGRDRWLEAFHCSTLSPILDSFAVLPRRW
jgi:hypothetical protein